MVCYLTSPKSCMYVSLTIGPDKRNIETMIRTYLKQNDKSTCLGEESLLRHIFKNPAHRALECSAIPSVFRKR